MNTIIATALFLALAGSTTAAQAGVNFNVSVRVPAELAPLPPVTAYNYQPVSAPAALPPQLMMEEAPRFIYAPSLGFYVSVDIPYDIVHADGRYYLYSGGAWYLATSYWGPWSSVPPRRLPYGLRSHRYQQVRQVRDREYRAFQRDREHYRGAWHRPSAEREVGRREDHRGDHTWEGGNDGRGDHKWEGGNDGRGNGRVEHREDRKVENREAGEWSTGRIIGRR